MLVLVKWVLPLGPMPVTRPCGWVYSNSVHGSDVWTVNFFNLNIPAGVRIVEGRATDGSYTILDMTGPVVNGSHSWTGVRGKMEQYSVECAPDCSDDSDCGPCEKCVDGECVLVKSVLMV